MTKTHLHGNPGFRPGAPLAGVLICLSLATGCAQEEPRVLEIEGFEAYVSGFQAEARARGVRAPIRSLVIRLGTVSGGTAACEINAAEPPTITVDREYWEGASETGREQTLYHELGHCVLRRVHLAKIGELGLPVSLMHPNKLHEEDYAAHRDELLDELFGARGEF